MLAYVCLETPALPAFLFERVSRFALQLLFSSLA
jgi:hypothetical protein